MSKGKYFLKTLEKAIHADETFLDGEEIKLVSPCCDGNRVAYGEGDFICEKFKMKSKGKKIISYFYTKNEGVEPIEPIEENEIITKKITDSKEG